MNQNISVIIEYIHYSEYASIIIVDEEKRQ